MKRTIWGLVLALTLTLSGCPKKPARNTPGPPSGSPTASPAASASPSTLASPTVTPSPSVCPKSSGGDRGARAHLTGVRVGTHAGFDRITFELEPVTSTVSLPPYEVAPAAAPFSSDPSGLPFEVAGAEHSGVVFFAAVGRGPEGTFYRGPTELNPGFPVLVEAQQQGDFEDTLSWVMGLARHSCPVLRELTAPLRLSIDFPH